MYIVLPAILVLTPSENLNDIDDTHCENGNKGGKSLLFHFVAGVDRKES